jgi:hypothetical protein
MKQIQPVQIWYQGQLINATIFNLYVISDNLIDTAVFYYALYSGSLDELGTLLVSGNLTMSGTDYTNYESSSTSNNFAYSWGATQLNLILL